MIGGVQLVGGLLRIGTFTRFVSEPVLTGFTAGAGVYIVINQLPAFLGISKAAIVKDLWGFRRCTARSSICLRLLRSLDGVHFTDGRRSSLLTFATVRVLQHFEPRIGRRLPAPFVAVVLTTLIVVAARSRRRRRRLRPREGRARHRAAARAACPRFVLPQLRPRARCARWSGPALAIGLMGSVEAIAIGKTLANRAGHPSTPADS